jgi:hypothetical protein
MYSDGGGEKGNGALIFKPQRTQKTLKKNSAFSANSAVYYGRWEARFPSLACFVYFMFFVSFV